MSECRVYIVLATHQGETYLPELLASLRSQSYRDWVLLARDDQSSDGTRRIVQEAAASDSRIVHLDDAPRRLGAAGNFAGLLLEAHRQGAGYVLLADQDDVWHSDKVARQVQALRAAEVGGTTTMPRLVFCDAAVIDDAGQTLDGSFLRYCRLPYQSSRPMTTLLGRSYVLGCACAVNRPLLDLALPLPNSIASHDWWLALCSAATGEIACLETPLLDYRRHGANASQSAIWDAFGSSGGLRQRWRVGWDHFLRSLDQARALRDRMRERNVGGAEATEILDAFCRTLDEPNRWRRLRQLHRLGVPKIGFLRRTLYDVCMLMK
jgi:glycosyltransferase involved in cell wall biosynthesis